MSEHHEELIGTVDVSRLRSGIRRMIMRPFAPHLVEQVELGRYLRELLATRRWSIVRVVPTWMSGECRPATFSTAQDPAMRHLRAMPTAGQAHHIQDGPSCPGQERSIE